MAGRRVQKPVARIATHGPVTSASCHYTDTAVHKQRALTNNCFAKTCPADTQDPPAVPFQKWSSGCQAPFTLHLQQTPGRDCTTASLAELQTRLIIIDYLCPCCLQRISLLLVLSCLGCSHASFNAKRNADRPSS